MIDKFVTEKNVGKLSFEERVQVELIKNEFEYEPRAFEHVFGHSMGPEVLYVHGVIKRDSKELLFCTPNSGVYMVNKDAPLYSDKKLIDLLFTLDVELYTPWHTTCAMRSLGLRPPKDNMHMCISPNDIKQWNGDYDIIRIKALQERMYGAQRIR